MPIRKIDKNIGIVPSWGDENFDENVHENFLSFKEIIPRLDNSIDDINEAIVVIDNISQTVNQKAQEVSQNAQTVNQNAQEVINNAQEVIQEAEEAIKNAQIVNQKAQEVSQNAQNVADNTSKASQWANNNYNLEVELGQFSAKHWATVAQNASANNPVSAAQQDALNLKVNISDIQNTLLSIDINKPLSAAQGKVLKDLIDYHTTLLFSDDTTLDEMHEVVSFIKQNKTDLQNLDLSNIAETITLKHFTATLLIKLNGIAENANNYFHPESHSASMITESAAKRFVSDEEKTSWNQKQDELVSAENIKTINGESIIGSGNITVSSIPAGTVITFVGSTAPIGYLKANGALLSRTTFANLWAFAQTSGALVSDSEWFDSKQGCLSTGDGSTTFRIPDLRGYFPRGWDDGRGIDTGRVFGSLQADGYLNHSHTASTNSQGAHTHTVDSYNLDGQQGIGSGFSSTYNLSKTTSSAGAHTHTVTVATSTTGTTETRPKNIALLYCIKY